jgi:hypothetical protein
MAPLDTRVMMASPRIALTTIESGLAARSPRAPTVTWARPKESATLKVRFTPETIVTKSSVSDGWVKVWMIAPLPSRMTEVPFPRMPSSSIV